MSTTSNADRSPLTSLALGPGPLLELLLQVLGLLGPAHVRLGVLLGLRLSCAALLLRLLLLLLGAQILGVAHLGLIYPAAAEVNRGGRNSEVRPSSRAAAARRRSRGSRHWRRGRPP